MELCWACKLEVDEGRMQPEETSCGHATEEQRATLARASLVHDDTGRLMDRVVWAQMEDLHARFKGFEHGGHDWEDARVTHCGTLKDEETLQRIDLYRIQMGDDEHVGPYDVVTATYIHNFWGDAEKRGEAADVVVFNGIDGYIAVDPADEAFPPVPADG